MSTQTKGTFIALIGIALWSTTAIFIGYLLTHYPLESLVLAFWRDFFVAVSLLIVLFLFRRSLLRIPLKQVGFYIFYGLILSLFNSIWTVSVATNGAAVSTVLAYSSAGITAVLAWWLFKETLGILKILAVTMSLGGCVMVSVAYDPQVWQLNPIGVATGLVSGLAMAFYSLMGREAARRKINTWTALFYSFTFGAFFILVFNQLPGIPGAAGSLKGLLPDMAAQGWLTLILLSIGPTVLGYGLYNASMNYIPASIANLLATLEPVMTAVQAYIVLGERMDWIQIIGSLVILSAVVIVQFERKEILVVEAV